MTAPRRTFGKRTFDLRLWVDLEQPWPALAQFLEAVRELAEAHPGIDPRWVVERRDRHGRPRVRVHVPHRDAGDARRRRSA